MRFARPITFVVLLLSGSVFGQDLKLPEKVSGPPGIIVVEAITTCKSLQWVALDKGISVVPSELLVNSKKGVFFGSIPGAYRVLAYGAKEDTPTPPVYSLIVVEGTSPNPIPNPIPTPTPTPVPNPIPVPVPVPTPVPDTPLVRDLKTALAKETEADKQKLKILVDLFQKAGKYADDDRNKTTKDINDMIKAVRVATVGDALPNVRAVLNKEAALVLTNQAMPLTLELRGTVKGMLNNLGDSLLVIQSLVPVPAAK